MASTARKAEPGPRPVGLPGLRIVDKPGLPAALVAEMPHTHSAVVEVLVRSGSAYETIENNGISHLLEHVVLAGSKRYPTRADLQRAIDSTGGLLDAFTHKELTEFSFQVLPAAAPRALELLGEALTRSTFSEEAVAAEREIVLEEMLTGNYEGSKNPFDQLLWGTDSVGLPIIGRREVIERTGPAELRACWERAYTARNMVVVVAGNVEAAAIEAALEAFRGLPEGSGPLQPAPAKLHAGPRFRCERFRSGSIGASILLRTPGFDGTDPRVHIILDLLTESFQTHVYQELIGPKLPVYYLQAGQETFLTEGLVHFSFNVSRDRFFPTLDRVLGVLDAMRASGIGEEELELSKRIYALGVQSNLDDPRDVAARLGVDLLLNGRDRALAIDRELELIEAVRPGDVRSVLDEVFRAGNLSVMIKGGLRWWKERGLRRRFERWLE